MWLRADTIIREKTQGRRSLDDFLASFFGQRDTGPVVVPYRREDVEASLSSICPYELCPARVLRDPRALPNKLTQPPTDGLEAAGWRLVYNSTPNRDFFFP